MSVEVVSKDVDIPTTDGFSIKATLFSPARSDNGIGLKAVVLIASATGVKRGYYAPFATFLVSISHLRI